MTEHYREQLILRTSLTDRDLRCFLEIGIFDAAQLRETIDCSAYLYRIPGRTPWDHLEMQQILDARREAHEARDQLRRDNETARAQQRRDTWIIGGLTMLAVIGGGIVAALIGRGIIWGPVG
ncbi:MAG: hypothetical protein OXQ29_08570 [Rhodospirillaceae bacterium]|nr:hypothetical protein [Rhodospirillaceae bacterium]